MYFKEISQANLVKSNSERIYHFIIHCFIYFEQFFPLKTNKELIVNNNHFILEYFEKSSFVFLGNKMS